MLQRLKNMLRAPEEKASRTARVVALQSAGRAKWTPRDYAALAREGFLQNAVVYRAVKLVAENVGSLRLLAYEGEAERQNHPLLALLAQPNPRQDKAALLELVATHLLLAGNAYPVAVTVDERPREIYALRPDRMRVVPGAQGWPEAFEYTVAGRTLRFDQDGGQKIPPILHLSLAHPLDDHYGFAPLEAAAIAIDTHNAAARWNKALLDNAACPSGALVYAGADRALLSDAQFERIKRELEATYQGSVNAGRPMLLEGGLDWKAMSHSPKDMDFLEAKHTAAREIALAFGVPPMLLGIPGDNTYSNYSEANRALWRQTVLPLAARLCAGIGQWLAPAYDAPVRLEIDTDRIDALAADRAAAWARIAEAPFLTLNEKREALGYSAVEGGDRIV